MYKLFTPKFAESAHLTTDSPTAQPPGPKPARRSRPIRHLKPPVERVRSRKRYRELFRRYGIPNAIDVGYGLFCGRTGAAFIDDDDGRIVAYAPPWIGLTTEEEVETTWGMIRPRRKCQPSTQERKP